MKTFLFVGGGTGGHITPLLSVARELKQRDNSVRIIYVGERGGGFADLAEQQPAIDEAHFISAGKFRRYHGESWLQRLFDLRTLLLNVRDMVRMLVGVWQAWRLLGRLQPDVVFSKGGFVAVPLCLAAHWRGIKIVTHDSDALPGLANRIVARWAVLHATGMPLSYYAYPESSSRYVGIPLAAEYQEVTVAEKTKFRQELGLDPNAKILFVVGGSLGAQRINGYMERIIDQLTKSIPNLVVLHQVGRGNGNVYGPQLAPNIHVYEFLHDLYKYSGAADVVVTRSGATNMAEFSVQGKACIVIPSPFLAGGHALKNADYYADKHAAVVLQEADLNQRPEHLAEAIVRLMQSPVAQEQLSQAMRAIATPNAAGNMANILLEMAGDD